MGFVQIFLLLTSIIFGTLTALLVIFSNSEDQGILANNQNSFIPGSFDSARNKVVAIFVAIFAFSILAINTIGVRSQKNQFAKAAEQAKIKEEKISQESNVNKNDYE